jgi:histidine phosphotransferase ChpT
MDLINKSARTASARLQFCRIAFGAAGSAGAQIDTGDAESMVRGFVDAEKVTVTWNIPRLLLPKNRVKLLMNMLVIAIGTIPRGGTLTVDPVGSGEATTFKITAAGLNARIPQGVPDLLEGQAENGTVDAHAVQPYYTGLLARACGLGVGLSTEGETVVVATR